MRECDFKAMIAAACAFALFSTGPASAGPAKNIQVAARVLTFLEKAPTGRTVIGVAFDPTRPASVAEKNAIMAAIGGGLTVGGLTIVGKPMEADAVRGVKFLFVTRGVDYAAVSSDARATGIVTMGSDLACVRSGACAIGISTDPTVQIVVNHKATAAVGASFKAAFRMMIQEI